MRELRHRKIANLTNDTASKQQSWDLNLGSLTSEPPSLLILNF